MDLEARVKRLERENQILKYGVLLVVAVVLFSAFLPQDQVQEVIQAHRFELRDTDGRLAAVLRLADTSEINPFGVAFGGTGKSTPGATLAIFGEGDDEAVSLRGGQDRATLSLRKENHSHSVSPDGFLLIRDLSHVVSLSHREENTSFNLGRVRLSANDGDTYLRLDGPGGIAMLGNTTTVNEQTGAETTFPVSTLTLYDAEGNVRHQIPR